MLEKLSKDKTRYATLCHDDRPAEWRLCCYVYLDCGSGRHHTQAITHFYHYPVNMKKEYMQARLNAFINRGELPDDAEIRTFWKEYLATHPGA